MTRPHTPGIRSAKQYTPEGDFDAVIIGSGISGMACAAILAREWLRPLVPERHYTAGGFTHVFRRGAYEWDVGIHYIGGVNNRDSLLRILFDYLTADQLDWADMGDVYDRVFFGDEQFAFHGY